MVAAAQDGEFAELASALSTIVRDRRYRLRMYKQCFVGKDAVDLIVSSGLAKTREEAAGLGQRMLEANIIQHVTKDHGFVDGYLFYRLVSDDVAAESFSKGMSLRSLGAEEPTERIAATLSGVEVKDRTYRLKTYKQCFVGKEAVDLLLSSGCATSREQAVKQGQMLMDDWNLFEHVLGVHDFEDGELFYRFTSSETRFGMPADMVNGDVFDLAEDTSSDSPIYANVYSTLWPKTDSDRHRRGTVFNLEGPWENVRTITLEDLDKDTDIGPTNTSENPVNILITIHSIESDYSNTVRNGLGLWVMYILKKYLKKRGIPCKLFLKSIVLRKNGSKSGDVTTLYRLKKFIQKNNIDILIPTDVTDTQFVSRNLDAIAPLVNCAVTSDVTVYQTLEDKWSTYNFCVDHGIPTPPTDLLEGSTIAKTMPFFLKISSGTNGGRGVWFIKSQEQLDETLALKECNEEDTLMICQKATLGRVICSQIVYNHGRPVGFFFAESKQADDLAGVGNRYIFSFKESEDSTSHIKVELEEEQWKAVTKIFCQVGAATKYHGLIDIEFIVAGDGNEGVEPGSVWLLECNPRFSGDIHTTLSNPGFLNAYFDVIEGNVDPKAPIKNFSRGVEMRAEFREFNPLPFYVKNAREVAFVRNWKRTGGVDRTTSDAAVDQSKSSGAEPSPALPSLGSIADKFVSAVEVKDRTYRFKSYRQCFVGKEAVDYLVNEGYAKSRFEAVKIGGALMDEMNLFEHVAKDHGFVDSYLFYQFVTQEERKQ